MTAPAHRIPRVLMVVGAYFPELAGGSLQCQALTRALGDRVSVRILTTTDVPGAPEQSEVDGVPVYRVFVNVDSWASKLVAVWRLWRVLRRYGSDCDIFHFHGFTEKMLVLFVAAKLSGRRTVEKLSSLGWDDPVSIRSRRFGRLLSAAQMRVDRVIAMTPALRDRCLRAGLPEARIVTIPNGVDTDRFAPVDAGQRAPLRRRLGLPVDGPLVAFVGFWSLEKGPHLAFDAWESARQRTGVDAAIVFVGATSPEHAEVDPAIVGRVRRRAAEADLRARVFFVESTNEVEAYLQAADVFVLPSSREGLSNALLEAMATGLPVITVEAPGEPHAVIDSGVNGFAVPPGDLAALTDVLAELLRNDGLRVEIGARARRTILERFAMGAVADRYVGLYAELLA